MANKNGVIIQSVSRALGILKCFENFSELGLIEISDMMNLSKSTAYGLVNTLVSSGFLEQSYDSKKYKLGIKNFELGNYVKKRMDITKEARPYLEILLNQFHETIHIAKHYDGEVVYIDKVEGSDFSIVSSQVGRRAPMHCTGVGKAQLAYLPMHYLDKYIFSKPLKQYTSNTIITKEELLKELELIRERGYALDNEEIEIGLRCVAVPILGVDGKPLVGVSISAPSGRMIETRRQEIIEALLKFAKQFSRQIGCS